MRTLHKNEFEAARQAFIEGKLQLNLMPGGSTQDWAKKQDWPSPSVGFKDAFLRESLKSKENWEKAWVESSADFMIND